MATNHDDPLRQQMLEMIHGLLSDDQQRALQEQIRSDPQAARTYSEVSTEAELIAKAARLEGPKIELPQQRSTRGTAARSSPAAWLPWVVYLALSLLVAVTVGGYLWDASQQRDLPSEPLRLIVAAPATITPGVEGRVSVRTESITGRPLAASVELSLRTKGAAPQQLLSGDDRIRRSDPSGRAMEFVIPANLAVTGPVQLEVLAHSGAHEPRFSRTLEIEPQRFATHLSLDKPWYQPGETVYFRSLTLEGLSLATRQDVPVEFEILDPAGAPLAGSKQQGVTDHGIGNGLFVLGAELGGGKYTLVSRSLNVPPLFAAQKQEFLVQQYRLSRLKKELELTRDSYAPGDEVVADFSAARAEGGPAAGAKLQIIATVDGKQVMQQDETVSATGTFQVRFKLPAEIERGDGQLAIVVDDGGTRETAAKTIPINLGKLTVDFYPEGGDLVAGLENRVYFTALSPTGESVHVEGQVIDGAGRAVAEIETVKDGRGSFRFTPTQGEPYQLKLVKPQNFKSVSRLPAANPLRAVAFSTGAGVFAAGDPVMLAFTSTRSKLPLVATATCRGTAVGQATHVTGIAGATEYVRVPLVAAADGVIRVTVYDYSGPKPEPIAERLVYRRPSRKLNVVLAESHVVEAAPQVAAGVKSQTSRAGKFSPGQTAELKLKITDEQGRPAAATLGVAVVDDALLALANEQMKQRPATMPTQFRLAAEIEKPEQLEDVNFYLSDDPQAAESLDLLLGTQGWRRFASQRLDDLVKHQPTAQGEREAREQVLASSGRGGPPVVYDNLDEIRGPYERQWIDFETAQTQRRLLVGRLAFYGGVALLVAIAALGLVQLLRAPRVWVPAMTMATLCLLVGGWWLSTPRRAPSGSATVAMFRSDDARPVAAIQSDQVGGTSTGGMPRVEGPPIVHQKIDSGGADSPERSGEDKITNLWLPRLSLRNKFVDISKLRDSERRLRASEVFGPRTSPAWNKQRADGLSVGKLFSSRPARRFPVRQYAHRRPPAQAGVRTDFTETLYWNPLVIANSQGEATIRFDLSDAVTTFRVRADAQAEAPSADGTSSVGQIGSGGGTIVSRIPLRLEPKLPLEVNAGDVIDLPLAVVNDSADDLEVRLSVTADKLLAVDGDAARSLQLQPTDRRREHFRLTVAGQGGAAKLRFAGAAGELSDVVERTMAVVPPGFPVSQSFSGRLDTPQVVQLMLPRHWVPGSLRVAARCFPTTLAELQAGMESMLREPCGCFEQASASNYPNVLALRYMQEHRVADPAITRRARALLQQGYAKLTGYECRQHGYEWFGNDPGHEALTAYGLMQFRDMEGVYEVDPAMVRRTADWLLARRDGRGGFQRSSQPHQFGSAPPEVTNAYIVWALTESGQKKIDKELEHLIDLGRQSDDPYLLALAAASAVNYGQHDAGRELLKKLATRQQSDGHLSGTQGSITQSGGLSLDVETTALAALAWLKLPEFTAQANQAVDWIVKHRQAGGGFGSTQGTILALKALLAHANVNLATVGGGALIVARDKQEIGRVAFAAGTSQTIELADLADKMQPGDNKLTLRLAGTNKMPYAVSVEYRTREPASQSACPIRLTTQLDAAQIAAGNTVALAATLLNTTDKEQPMTVAILGIPGGTRPRADQLEALKRNGTLDYFETRPREIICYWRALAPNCKIELRLDLVAEIPGHYTAPASRAYLYYTAEQKQWAEPLEIEIGRE